MDLESLVSLRNALDEYNMPHFFFGGWGLDIVHGQQTRDHIDADIVIWDLEKDRLLKFLERQRCRIWDEGVKLVFGNEFFEGEVVFMKEDGGSCKFEGKFFSASLPANALLPFTKARIAGEEFCIGSRELIIKMAQQFSRFPADRKLADLLARQCDKKIMDKIDIARK
jgi:hypothetical protein